MEHGGPLRLTINICWLNKQSKAQNWPDSSGLMFTAYFNWGPSGRPPYYPFSSSSIPTFALEENDKQMARKLIERRT